MLSDERIQILGLHTCNPIVSYYNQIFSCSWADQIGTELIFSHPDEDADSGLDHSFCPPLQQGPAYHLIAANSVKLLGRKANIVSSSGPVLAQEENSTHNSNPTDSLSSSQAPTNTNVPRRAEPPSHQASFIQRLQALKAEKGEADAVRTTMSTRRANPNLIERLNAWARTEAQLAQIKGLNIRASNGDQSAEDALLRMLRELEDLQNRDKPV